MKTLRWLTVLMAGCWCAHADLTVTVYPGYTFTSSETPTTSKLNRLGRPSVYVTGTLSGTNVLGNETVAGNHLNSNIVGSNMTFDGSSPRKLVVSNAGIGPVQLTASVAGAGLAGGAGTALSVLVDSNSIINTGDVLALNTNLTPAYLPWVTNALIGGTAYFTNASITIPSGWWVSNKTLIVPPVPAKYAGTNAMVAAGEAATFTHGLSGRPQTVLVSLVCTTNDAATGYVAGDEITLGAVSTSNQPLLGATVSSNSVVVRRNSDSSFRLVHKTTGTVTAASEPFSFSIRVDAVRFD